MKVVVVTPNASDSHLAEGLLAEHGVHTVSCASLAEVGPLVDPDIGCVVLVEESLVEPDVQGFREMLRAQPPWSDVPLLLISARESSLSALDDGVFPHSGNLTFLQHPLHPVSLFSAVNVALRARQRQLEIRDLLAQRERVVRQKDEFLAMLAHELRNPLAPIRNAAYLLGTLEYSDPLFLKCRAMIEKQTRHVTRLLDDLLDVSRLELGKVDLRMQRVNLNEALTAAADACVPLTSARRHAVNLKPWKQPLAVRADPVRLEQAIANLIMNAAKFTPEGGTIDVEASQDEDYAVVAVTDNGVGIKPEMLESIFDLFTQEAVSPARTEGGLGIGLTLVKRLVELHGGSVHAFSAGLGSGSRFEARLPLDARRTERDSAHSDSDIVSQPRRVLIVEDGEDTRDSLGMLISAWSHEVTYAATGPEGVRRAREAKPDVALIDIALPGFDGYEVARRIRHEDSSWARKVRLIALTGYGQSNDRAKAIDAGFDVHVTAAGPAAAD